MKELSDCRILIVDDAEANVDVLANALGDDDKLSVAIDGAGPAPGPRGRRGPLGWGAPMKAHPPIDRSSR